MHVWSRTRWMLRMLVWTYDISSWSFVLCLKWKGWSNLLRLSCDVWVGSWVGTQQVANAQMEAMQMYATTHSARPPYQDLHSFKLGFQTHACNSKSRNMVFKIMSGKKCTGEAFTVGISQHSFSFFGWVRLFYRFQRKSLLGRKSSGYFRMLFLRTGRTSMIAERHDERTCYRESYDFQFQVLLYPMFTICPDSIKCSMSIHTVSQNAETFHYHLAPWLEEPEQLSRVFQF